MLLHVVGVQISLSVYNLYHFLLHSATKRKYLSHGPMFSLQTKCPREHTIHCCFKVCCGRGKAEFDLCYKNVFTSRYLHLKRTTKPKSSKMVHFQLFHNFCTVCLLMNAWIRTPMNTEVEKRYCAPHAFVAYFARQSYVSKCILF